MSLWSRIGRRVREFVERFTEPPRTEPEHSPSPEPEPPDHGGGITGDPGESEESRLPDGWVLVGLYHEGEKTQRIHATDDTDATDSQIQHADAIIVWYEPAGDDGYHWIHGATGWDSIADQIERTVKVVSPQGSGT